MNTLFGIKNCDTVKKAQKWLDANQVSYDFHDVRVDGLTKDQVTAWCQQLGWETLLNKRSTTYRGLSDEIKQSMNESIAIEQMLLAPTLIKRPVLENSGDTLVGFKEAVYQQAFVKS